MIPDPSNGSYVLYSDFNCPFCYAMHERLHAQGVMDQVKWRGVQHAPHLPIPMARWNGRLMEELRHEVALVGRLTPTLSINIPAGKPNTRPAILLVAAILAHDPAQGMRLVRHLHQRFWQDGQDISDAGVLQEVLRGLAIHSDSYSEQSIVHPAAADEWDAHWHHTGQPGVSLLVRPDGAHPVGLTSEADVVEFFAFT